MYHVETINIKCDTPFFEFCSDITNKAKNMFNVSNFYIRNTMTGIKKDDKEITDNEKEVLDIVSEAIAAANKKNETKGKSKQFKLPTEKKWFLGYNTLDAIFKESNNVDYRATHIHVAQNVIKECVKAWKSYFSLLKIYNKDNKTLSGMPKIPKYCKSEHKTAVLSNIAAYIKDGALHIPYAKVTFDVSNVPHASTDKFIEARIIPYYDIYQLQLVTDDLTESKEIDKSIIIPDDAGIMSIDPGVENFATIVDNKGFTPIIIKGRYLKSLNQYYNKARAKYQSILMQGHDSKKYHYKETKRLKTISRKRDEKLRNAFYKTAHYICRVAINRNIEYIVFGKNDGWKNKVNTGHKNNQEFVQLPHAEFLNVLTTVSQKYNITVVTQNESYSSKASFLDNDFVPDYNANSEEEYVFSGRRTKRGLYKTANGIILNADVNGAANILKKKVSNAFKNITDFSYLYNTVQAVKVPV